MTKKEISKKLYLLAVVLGESLLAERADAYIEILKDYSDDDIIRIFNKATRTCKFFPKPVEMIEIITGKQFEKPIKGKYDDMWDNAKLITNLNKDEY